MSEKILVPALGESITEATVSKWLKNKGEAVNADEPVVELETDKVNLEVPSPTSGILSEIKSKDGATVEVGSVLGIISQGNVKLEKKEEVTRPKNQKIEEVKLPEEKSNIDSSPGVSESEFVRISAALDNTKHLGQLKSVYTNDQIPIDSNEQLNKIYKNKLALFNRNKPTDDGWDI